MTSPHTPSGPPQQADGPGQQARHRRHRWMMVACCIPMIALFVAVWAAGLIPASFLIIAVACTAMMALMMGGMRRGEAGSRASRQRR